MKSKAKNPFRIEVVGTKVHFPYYELIGDVVGCFGFEVGIKGYIIRKKTGPDWQIYVAENGIIVVNENSSNGIYRQYDCSHDSSHKSLDDLLRSLKNCFLNGEDDVNIKNAIQLLREQRIHSQSFIYLLLLILKKKGHRVPEESYKNAFLFANHTVSIKIGNKEILVGKEKISNGYRINVDFYGECSSGDHCEIIEQ